MSASTAFPQFATSFTVDPGPQDRPPMAVALDWVTRITTVALEMVLPGLVGLWLDRRWGTSFIGLVGFAIGMILGFWHLLLITRSVRNGGPRSKPPAAKDSK
jgi:hypothetical protein